MASSAPPFFEPMAESGVRRPLVPEAATHTHLYPGHILAPTEPTTLTTILGSCVAVCLWDQVRMVGGMNHFLLPDSPLGERYSGRYASVACRRLLDAFLESGSERRHLLAKVFGGACVIGALEHSARQLGDKNVDAALAFLADERIPVIAKDVGGRLGRKLVYSTSSGDAWVRSIHRGGVRGR
jgi:chemotaxis protein CheD